jgi:hypothetical protein
MLRPHIRSVTLVLVLLSACCVYAAQPGRALSANRVVRPSSTAGALAVIPLARAEAAAVLHWTLPPEDKPKTRWPWWLRILAVIGVLVFIRLVAGTVRNKPSGSGPV